MNNDGKIDFIRVNDIQEKDTHTLVLSTYISKKEIQDIAVIGIEKTGDDKATLQIEGDTNLYAENIFVEPNETVETSKGGKGGPNSIEVSRKEVIVNVWFWPSVRYLYAPTYIVWNSPWYWGYYPKWWTPWRPYSYTIFYSRCAPYRVYYHRVPTRRVVVAHNIYVPRRNYSTMVVHTNTKTTTVVKTNNRNTTVVTRNTRSNVNAVRVTKTRPTSVRVTRVRK